jgi:predicted kinase
MTEHTYEECLRRAEEHLFRGGRIIVDANFGNEEQRQNFLDAAARWCVPAVFVVCRASPNVARARIAARRGDASDADVSVYEELAGRWQETGPQTRLTLCEIDTDGLPHESLERAAEELRQARLLS